MGGFCLGKPARVGYGVTGFSIPPARTGLVHSRNATVSGTFWQCGKRQAAFKRDYPEALMTLVFSVGTVQRGWVGASGFRRND
jgi:hypothetical protein